MQMQYFRYSFIYFNKKRKEIMNKLRERWKNEQCNFFFYA